MSPRAREQRVKFFDQYRSYVINYNLGKDLVQAVRRAPRRERPGEALAGVPRAAVVAAVAGFAEQIGCGGGL